MKTKLILFCGLIPVFAGCDLIKDASTVTITTELTADVPIEVISSGKKSADQTGAFNSIGFTETQDLTLASNPDLEPYLSKIDQIDLNSLVVFVTGLSYDQTIISISLDVTGVGNIFTQNNITMTSNSFTPVIAAGKLDQVAAKMTSDKKITFTISGTASGPMTFTVGLNFDASVTASAL